MMVIGKEKSVIDLICDSQSFKNTTWDQILGPVCVWVCVWLVFIQTTWFNSFFLLFFSSLFTHLLYKVKEGSGMVASNHRWQTTGTRRRLISYLKNKNFHSSGKTSDLNIHCFSSFCFLETAGLCQWMLSSLAVTLQLVVLSVSSTLVCMNVLSPTITFKWLCSWTSQFSPQ